MAAPAPPAGPQTAVVVAAPRPRPEFPSICLSSIHCGHCRFELSLGDSIVMITARGFVSPRFTRVLFDEFYSWEQRLEFHACGGYPWLRCTDPDERVPGYHASCLAFRPHRAAARSLVMSNYVYDASGSDEARRRGFIRQRLTDRLSRQTTPRSLPLEVWSMVAAYLVRECAIVSTEQQWLRDGNAVDTCVDLTYALYARYVVIDGLMYVAGLANAVHPAHQGGWHLISDPMVDRRIDMLYAAEDHLGVRKLLLVRGAEEHKFPRSDTTDDRALWWKTISISRQGTLLDIKTDGLKVRDVISPQDSRRERFRWSSPQPSMDNLTFRGDQAFSGKAKSAPIVRLDSIKINDASVTGYSACLDWSILTLRESSAGGEADPNVYRDMDTLSRDIVWIHAPLSPGEMVVELWKRCGSPNLWTCDGLLLVTNRGRFLFFGRYVPLPAARMKPWYRIFRFPRARTSRVFFNAMPRWVLQIASDAPEVAPSRRHVPPSQLPSARPIPAFVNGPPWGFYTSAPFRNVVEVIPCQRKLASHSPIVGMLLRYANGTRECVGQYRLDSLAAPVPTQGAPKLCLAFARPGEGKPYITRLEAYPPRERGEWEWLDLPWGGRLEWWANPHELKIYSQGQESPS